MAHSRCTRISSNSSTYYLEFLNLIRVRVNNPIVSVFTVFPPTMVAHFWVLRMDSENIFWGLWVFLVQVNWIFLIKKKVMGLRPALHWTDKPDSQRLETNSYNSLRMKSMHASEKGSPWMSQSWSESQNFLCRAAWEHQQLAKETTWLSKHISASPVRGVSQHLREWQSKLLGVQCW